MYENCATSKVAVDSLHLIVSVDNNDHNKIWNKTAKTNLTLEHIQTNQGTNND